MVLSYDSEGISLDYAPIRILRDDDGATLLLSVGDGPAVTAFSERLQERDLQGGGDTFAALLAALMIDAGMSIGDVEFDPEGDMLAASFEDDVKAEAAAALLLPVIQNASATQAAVDLAERTDLPDDVELE